MAALPAYCPHCNTFFANTNAIVGNIVLRMEGCEVSCPNCGKLAPIKDGTYFFTEKVTQYFESTNLSMSDVRTLYALLKQAERDHLSIEDVHAAIDEKVPKASGLKQYIPEIGIYLAVLSLLLGLLGNYIAYQAWQHPVVAPTTPAEPKREQGVNEPCLCGSGRKYKKCCASKLRQRPKHQLHRKK